MDIVRLIAGNGEVTDYPAEILGDQPRAAIIDGDYDDEVIFTYATRIDEGQGDERHAVLIFREANTLWL